MDRAPTFAFVAFALALAISGCSAATSQGASLGDSDYTSEHAENTSNVPSFTESDQVPADGARIRVSVNGEAFEEAQGNCAWTVQAPSDGASELSGGGPWSCAWGAKAIGIRFGDTGVTTLTPGTFTCDGGDALVFQYASAPRGEGELGSAGARACSVVIDAVGPSKDGRAVVYGHFEAATVRGTFAGYMPIRSSDGDTAPDVPIVNACSGCGG